MHDFDELIWLTSKESERERDFSAKLNNDLLLVVLEKTRATFADDFYSRSVSPTTFDEQDGKNRGENPK